MEVARTENNVRNFSRKKNLLCLALGAVSLVLFLSLPLFSKTDNVYDIDAPIYGWRLLALFVSGFRFSFDAPGIGLLDIAVPAAVCALLLVAFVVCLFNIAVSVYGLVRGEYRAWFCLAPLAMLLYSVVCWIVLLSGGGIETQNFTGAPVKFYETFSVGIALLVIAVVELLQLFVGLRIREGDWLRLKRYAAIYAMAVPPLVLIFVFCLYPILLQIVMAFKDYTFAGGIWNSVWVGFENFRIIFASADMLRVLGNTVYVSFVKIVISIVFPLLFAIFIFDLPLKRYKKAVQTILFIPHFFSWVVIYGIAYAFLNPSGLVNSVVTAAGGDPQFFLESKGWFMPIQALTFGWKEIGWNTIIYFAALSGIDPALYDAAKVDGAGPLQRLVHITIPSLMPVLIFMTILSLGNILKSAGGEQMLLFYNLAVKDQAMVIDTWLYYRGMIDLEYGVGSAMSFLQSAFGSLLVVFCNWLSKRTTDRTIW